MNKQFWSLALIVIIYIPLSGCVCEVCQSVSATCTAEVYFVSQSEDNVIKNRLIAILDTVKDTTILAVYSFTDDQLGDVVVRAYQRGVRVQVILDGAQDTAQGGEY